MSLFQKKGEEKPETPPAEPEILIEAWSPLCDVQAFVEDNGTSVCFYLWFYQGTEYGRIKSCWVCNRGPSPEEIDFGAMERGVAPMMPAEFTGHAAGGIRLEKEGLEILWFEEGDAAALLDKGELLAVIPGWSGENFYGYSRYARGQGPFAWELAPAEKVLGPRLEKSAAYWKEMERDYWTPLQTHLLAAYEGFFGAHEKYYAIDGGNFPAKALITAAKDGIRYAVTMGVCALAQPLIEEYLQEDAAQRRRIELGFACKDGAISDEGFQKILGYISAQTQLPWAGITWLGHGHTLSCDAIEGFSAVLLLNGRELKEGASPELGQWNGEAVNLLWMVPLTEAECERMQENDGKEGMLAAFGPLEELILFDGRPKFRKGKGE